MAPPEGETNTEPAIVEPVVQLKFVFYDHGALFCVAAVHTPIRHKCGRFQPRLAGRFQMDGMQVVAATAPCRPRYWKDNVKFSQSLPDAPAESAQSRELRSVQQQVMGQPAATDKRHPE